MFTGVFKIFTWVFKNLYAMLNENALSLKRSIIKCYDNSHATSSQVKPVVTFNTISIYNLLGFFKYRRVAYCCKGILMLNTDFYFILPISELLAQRRISKIARYCLTSNI